MSDSTIINAISKIHFTIISFFTIIGLFFLLLFTLLHQGFTLDKLMLPGFKIEQLYIKWNEKLILNASSIIITKSNTREKQDFDLSIIRKSFEAIKWFDGWVEAIDIGKIRVNNIYGNFYYKTGDRGYINIATPDFYLQANLGFNEQSIAADITRLADFKHGIRIKGQAVLDLNTLTAMAALHVNVAKSADLTLNIEADTNMLSFNVSTDHSVESIKPIVDIFGLPKEISQWIDEKGVGSAFTLHTLKGSLPYDNPSTLLQTLYAEGTWQDLVYRFDDAIAPIVTTHTDLVFTKGILKIYPRSPTFYAQDGGKSWLSIDFNPKDVMLHVHILTDAQLNDDILFLLKHYGIDLPFKQSGGTTAVNLALSINLRTINIQANALFHVDKGVYQYNGIDLNISNAQVTLHNTDVTIDRLGIAYKEAISTSVTGAIDLHKHQGKLKILAHQITLPTPAGVLRLDEGSDLQAYYYITTDNDSILFGDSHWNIAEQNISVEGFESAFDFKQYTAKIPPVLIKADTLASAYVSGRLNLKHMKTDLKLNVTKFLYNDIELNQSHTPIALIYDQNLHIHFKELSHWKIGDTALSLYPTHLISDSEKFTILKNHFRIEEERVSGNLLGSYDFKQNRATFELNRFTIKNETLGTLFRSDESIRVDLVSRMDGTTITAPDFNLSLAIKDQDWNLSIADIGNVSRFSTPLSDYNLTSGSFFIESNNGTMPYHFRGTIHYPYPVLVLNNQPLYDYTFTGEYSSDATRIIFNEHATLNIGETITLKSDGAGYNIKEILAFINERKSTQEERKIVDFTLEATNSYIYLTPERRAEARKLSLRSDEDGVHAYLSHEKGLATFEYHNKSFYLYGHDFSDTFMSHLLALAEYKGGKMGFAINGDTSRAEGVVRINDTIIKDYKVLNNILALINTIPSLTTFSLPHYAKEGIAVSEAYTNFTYENGIVYVKGVKVDSHEIDITGDGELDYNNNRIDMELNLITDLGSNFSKVPLVGYIFFGDDGSISTTLEITGSLDNPSVKTAIAKDIVIAPFNIIKRTLTFPFQIFKKDEKE